MTLSSQGGEVCKTPRPPSVVQRAARYLHTFCDFGNHPWVEFDGHNLQHLGGKAGEGEGGRERKRERRWRKRRRRRKGRKISIGEKEEEGEEKKKGKRRRTMEKKVGRPNKQRSIKNEAGGFRREDAGRNGSSSAGASLN